MSATAIRIRAASGRTDNDYFQAKCKCGWKGSPHSNRSIEGRGLAERDAQNHRCERRICPSCTVTELAEGLVICTPCRLERGEA